MVGDKVTFSRLTGDRYCGIDGCRQQRGYIESGRLVCRAGHVHPDWQDAQEDEGEQFSQGRISRVSDKETVSTRTTLSGRKGLQLYFMCYQHLLRHQCHALIQTKGFPAELERVVRGLWALRLPVMEQEVGSKMRKDGGDETDGDDAPSMPLYSSQSEAEGGQNTRTYRERRRRLPSVDDSLGLLYIASMILLLPLSLSDLQRWARDEEVPYVRVWRLIPGNIQSALPPRYRILLEPAELIEEDHLYTSTRELIYLYHRHFKLTLPPLNYYPVLLGHIRALGLPLNVYRHVQLLAEKLSLDFPFASERKRYHPHLPEILLLALVIVATKLLYPFSSDIEYAAHSVTDPAFMSLSWSAWSEAHHRTATQRATKRAFTEGREMDVEDEDVPNFSKGDMDQWMDWYAKTWLGPDSKVPERIDRNLSLPSQLLDMFPVEYGKPRESEDAENNSVTQGSDERYWEAAEKRLGEIMAAMHTRTLAPDGADLQSEELGMHRLGEKYEVFYKADELSGHAKEFYSRVASRGTVSLRHMVRAARLIERQLNTIQVEQRGMKMEGEDIEIQGVEG